MSELSGSIVGDRTFEVAITASAELTADLGSVLTDLVFRGLAAGSSGSETVLGRRAFGCVLRRVLRRAEDPDASFGLGGRLMLVATVWEVLFGGC